MKIYNEVESIENISSFKSDGIILSTKYSFFKEKIHPLTKQLIEDIHNLKKEVIVRIDKIMMEDEIEEVYNFLDGIIYDNIDYFIFSDMAIYSYFYKKNLINKLIFNAPTLCCSYNEIKEYQKLGISCIMSTELMLDDMIINSALDNCLIIGYGYFPIFYSKRSLLSSYSKNYNLKEIVQNKKYTICEENRIENYPIVETDCGTVIFSNQKIQVFEELEKLKNISTIILNNYFEKDETFIKVVDKYNDLLNNDSSNQNDDCFSNTTKSFMYKKALVLGDKNE